MPEAPGEYGMVRTYLDWLIELPWQLPEETPIDIAEARRILDADHYGLEKIKTRIIEYPRGAQARAAGQGADPVLRRPSGRRQDLARPVDRARHGPQVRARVASAACTTKPKSAATGAPISAPCPATSSRRIRKAGTRNCVMMLDEIDKLGAGIHGDPSAALLEVLDPEQNNTFRDNYLGVPFDLSRVVFIATANMLDTIPGPLRDRMEIISLAGYTEDGEAADRHALSGQAPDGGERPEGGAGRDHRRRRCAKSSTATRAKRACAISSARSARSLRNAAVRLAEGETGTIRVDTGDLTPILGQRKFESEVAMRTSVPGVATGLAWTPVGGDILFIEATRMHGTGRLILTGQLGDVMKESAQAALSIVKNRAVAARHRSGPVREDRTSTCTCRRARSRRTGRAPASPCSWR